MKTLILVTSLALGGCAYGHYWTKPGSTELDFKRAYYQCMQESRGWSAGGTGLMGAAMIASAESKASDMRKMCLEAQGWKMGETHWEHRGLWKPLP